MRQEKDWLLAEAGPFLRENGLDGLEARRLDCGLSNISYLLGGKYILKLPYDSRFKMLDKAKAELQEKAAGLFISPHLICYDSEKGYSVSSYLADYKPISPEIVSLTQISGLLKTLRNFEAMNPAGIEKLDYQSLLDKYRLMTEPRKRIYVRKLEQDSCLSQCRYLSHFDLVSGNMLSNAEGAIRLIDYEFVCLAPAFFDLTSLLYENSFSDQTRQIIAEAWFNGDSAGRAAFKAAAPRLRAIADLLWYHWALARSDIRDEKRRKAFENIAEEKLNSLKDYLKKQEKP